MNIGAVSLRDGINSSSQQRQKINFGQESKKQSAHKTDEKKHPSHKAIYAAGTIAGLAVLGFAFRNKIKELGIFKQTKENVGTQIDAKKKEMIADIMSGLQVNAEKNEITKKSAISNLLAGLQQNAQTKAQALETKVENVVQQTTGTVKKAAKAAFEGFSAEEAKVLSEFKKTGKNEKAVFEVLKKYGMDESQISHVKGALNALSLEFKKRGPKSKPITLRQLLTVSFKEQSPEKVIQTINDSANKYADKYKLKFMY